MREIILPPTSHITRSKTVNETISLIADFRDFVLPGETFASSNVTVTVFSGLDDDPGAFLYGGVTVTQGFVLEQRIREGIPGVIYSVSIEMSTNVGNTYLWETRVAVLPNTNTAIPAFDVVYLTSELYPIESWEMYTSAFNPLDGKMLYQPTDMQYYSSAMQVLPGLFYDVQLYYTLPANDFYSSALGMLDGLFYPIQLYYTLPPNDFYTSSMAFFDGTFVKAQVFYTLPADDFYSSGVTILDGTFS